MKRAISTVAVLAVLAAGGLSGCTGQAKAPAAAAGSVPSTTTGTPAPPPAPAPILSDAAATKVQARYEKAIASAAVKRNAKSTKALQAGPLLTISLADYRATEGMHRKAFKALKLTSPTNLLPATTAGHGWFLSTSYQSGAQGAAYASLFERSGPSAPWRKSLEIWLGDNSLDGPVLVAGVAQQPDAHGRAQDAAAVKALEHYLATGKAAKKLTGRGPATYTRKYLRKDETGLEKGATATMRCTQPKGSVTEALKTSTGTDVVASLQCTITKHAKAGWRLFLKNQWKALSNRSTGLRSFTVRETVQVAMTVTRHDGTAHVVGVSWETVGVTAS